MNALQLGALRQASERKRSYERVTRSPVDDAGKATTAIQRAQQSHNRLLRYAYRNWGDGSMREEETETCNFTFEGLEPPQNSPFIWRDAVRHRHAVKLLARQLAFKETGEQ